MFYKIVKKKDTKSKFAINYDFYIIHTFNVRQTDTEGTSACFTYSMTAYYYTNL